MKPTELKDFAAFRSILIIAGLFVIIGGMMQAKAVLIPFMMASFIAIVCQGPITWIQKKGLPKWLAMLTFLLLFCGAGLLSAMVVSSSVKDFTNNIPEYQIKLEQDTDQFYTFLGSKGIHIGDTGLRSMLKPSAAIKYAGYLFNELSQLMANGFLVLMLIFFILLEAGGLPAKLKAIFINDDKKIIHLQKFIENVKHYMSIKTIISLITGLLVTLSLLLIGVDYPVMWGMLAFAFNFIPSIGSIIAAVPAVLLALMQLGLTRSLAVAACYLIINIVLGNIIEPRYMGKGLGLSTLVVFLSLLFWGWVFGPVGMLLSVVITMMMKLILESSAETKWLAILLGPNPGENEVSLT